ncbi:hypothetical protein ATEIFO6365_0006036400 [Aspergillus terreus]|uniref:Uncharacterized protein n=1 Tax=Aspergillus terreus TaxID=33178 RepID=A0A5M3YWT5_ASPTE|nr:hypothetical protein ATETN484_0005036200 [Aspergillus terreus]GFF17027.1 hypothetical protein ATEIFO6365_0006036400 [Aspergillus terreus]
MPLPMYQPGQQSSDSTPPSSSSLSNSANNSGRVHNSDTNTAPTSAADALRQAGGNQPLSREEAERLYEERMEEEYAKREGGA